MQDVAPQSPSHLVPGYRLDRYELLYPLAQGGMATVWVARLQGKHGFEKLVAIKTILPQYADDPEFQSMFLDEARIAARIRHPNVAEIMDLGEEDGTLFLVMEWVDGDSLAKLYNAVIRAQKRFPLPLIARITADACAGLHAAHELHDDSGRSLVVVHRDVSPQNILVSVGGTTKIIDFGVAKAAQRLTQETSAGLVKGKIQYASPEQATGGQVDRRSDIWAMGTVIYQMVTGRLPYDGENQLATLHMLTSGKPPRSLPPTVPRALSEVVKRALAFRPEDRFATALDMQRALEASVPPLATPAEVSALVQEFLGDRSEGRKRDVQGALAALSSRARIQVPSGDSAPRILSQPGGTKTPAPASGVNVRPPQGSFPKQTLMGVAPPPPPLPGASFTPPGPPPMPPARSPAPSHSAVAAPPPLPGPPAFSSPPPLPSGGQTPFAPAGPSPFGAPPFPGTPEQAQLPQAPAQPWSAEPFAMPPPEPASPSGRPVPSVIVAADALGGVSSGGRSSGGRQLRPIHMVLGGSALIVMLGVWSAVAIVLLHAPREAPPTSAHRETAGAAAAAVSTPPVSTPPVAPPAAVTATATPAAEPVATQPVAVASATASAAPPEAAPAPPATTSAPAAAIAAPVAPPAVTAIAPPVAAPLPVSTNAPPAAPPKGKKKKKYDDGF